MTNNEVNKVIAEYMGGELCLSDDTGNAVIGYEPYTYFEMDCYKNSHNLFTNSLDALVPVWEKMDIPNILEMDIRNHTQPVFAYRVYTDLAYTHHHEAKTIQEAAAHATAKAILALGKK
jgi:hypothetical protein